MSNMKIPFWLAKIIMWHPCDAAFFLHRKFPENKFCRYFYFCLTKLWQPIGMFFQQGYFGTKNSLFILVYLTEIEEAYLLFNFHLITDTEEGSSFCFLENNKANNALKRDYEKRILSKQENISLECFLNIEYLRTRSNWTKVLEHKLISFEKETGKQPDNINKWFDENLNK